MKRIIIIIGLLLIAGTAMAIDFYRVVGGRSAALGRTGVCERNCWSLHNNPSGLASLRGWQGGVYYENQWLLRATAFKSGIVAAEVPKVGVIGLGVSQFGGSGYSENKFGMAYARGFGPYLQMGLTVEYQWLHWWEGYPSLGVLSFSLGMQSEVTERLRFGVCLFNPIQRRVKTLQEDRLPTVLRFGMAYRFTDDFVGQCEVERDNSRVGVRLGAGFEYLVWKRFSLRAGAQYNPGILCFGVGYRVWKIQMDVSAQMHQVLGASVQVGFAYGG